MGSGLPFTMACARSAAARAPATASDSSSPPAMYAATAVRYCRSTSPKGDTSSAPGCAYRSTPTAPTAPVEVFSGAIIAARAAPDGETAGPASGSCKMLGVSTGCPV